MIDFLILYEHKEREIESICLLSYELENRGYSVDILNIHDYNRIKYIFSRQPKVILVPALYQTSTYHNYVSKIVGNVSKVVNLQWEQVLSEYWEELGFHNPREKAVYPLHLCWGEDSKKRLLDTGTKNAHITGAIHIDFLRKEFLNYFLSKDELIKSFNLDYNKKIVLYISSFTLSSMESDQINSLSSGLKTDMTDFYESMVLSRKTTLIWIKKLLSDRTDIEFIYRPHPNENVDEVLLDIENSFENFKIIKTHSVRQWILVSDKIFTWISTSIVDAFFLKKHCGIVRPVKLDTKLEPVIYKNANHIETYDDFIYAIDESTEKEFPIKPDLIKKHYDIDHNLFAYQRVCNLLEEVYTTKQFDTPKEINEMRLSLIDIIKILIKKTLWEINHLTNNFIRNKTSRFKKIESFFKTRESQIYEILSEKEISRIKLKINKTLLKEELK